MLTHPSEGGPIENKYDQRDAVEEDTALLPSFPLDSTQRVDGYTTKSYMTYMPEDPQKKAEVMAMEMRRCKRRHLIASKRALRNPQTTEELSMCAMSGGR